MPSYPFAPRVTFRVLRKLDAIFASLLTGVDVEGDSGAPLAGFEGRREVVSMTEKVRIKSVAETARVVVFEARDSQEEGGDEDEEDAEDDEESQEVETVVGKWEMEAAQVYERTIQLLGDEFGRAGELG